MRSNIKGKTIISMPGKGDKSGKVNIVKENGNIGARVRAVFKEVEGKHGKEKAIVIIYQMLAGNLLSNIQDPADRTMAKKEILDLAKEIVGNEAERIEKNALSLGTKSDQTIDIELVALKYINYEIPEEDREKVSQLVKIYQQEHNRRSFVSIAASITDGFKFLAETPELYYAKTGYKSTRKFPDTKSLLRFEQLRSMVCSAMEKDNISEEQAIDIVLNKDVQLKNRVDAAVKRDKISAEKAIAKIVPRNVQLLGKRDREVLRNRQRVINPTRNIEEPEL